MGKGTLVMKMCLSLLPHFPLLAFSISAEETNFVLHSEMFRPEMLTRATHSADFIRAGILSESCLCKQGPCPSFGNADTTVQIFQKQLLFPSSMTRINVIQQAVVDCLPLFYFGHHSRATPESRFQIQLKQLCLRDPMCIFFQVFRLFRRCGSWLPWRKQTSRK